MCSCDLVVGTQEHEPIPVPSVHFVHFVARNQLNMLSSLRLKSAGQTDPRHP